MTGTRGWRSWRVWDGRRSRRWWLAVPAAVVLVLALALGLAAVFDRDATGTAATRVAAGTGAPGAAGAETLILYDDSPLGELYATQTANLASHFGDWTAKPVGDYADGEVTDYSAVIYLGSTYDEPLPEPFLDDVLAGTTEVMWVRDNLWQLAEHSPSFTDDYGFTWGAYDHRPVDEVRYQDTSLTRDTANEAALGTLQVADPERVETLATAVAEDGSTLPWATKAGNITYLSELPYLYVSPDDRYLAFTDLLYDLLAPETEERHRALLRLEDVGPQADPARLREIGDYLAEQQVPFSVAVYPVYVDPHGEQNNGEPRTVRLQDRPEVVAALRHLVDSGGTLVMHGYTHQYEDAANPYHGISGDDFEFYRAHVDEQDHVQLDGPAADDSPEWTAERLDAAYAEFDAAGLPRPPVFEFPHYAAGPNAYDEVAQRFTARYDRGMYFPGVLGGGEVDHARGVGQFVPYLVRDVYDSVVVPENLGEVTKNDSNQHAARSPADLLDSAERNLVVRDGTASFFYHPFLGVEDLRELVDGLKDQGYDFTSADAVRHG